MNSSDGLKERLLATGDLHSADFDERTLTFRIAGDMPPVTRGRYVMLHLSDWQRLTRAALHGDRG